MRIPFRRSMPLYVRLLNALAAAAGTFRLALRQRTLHPQLAEPKSGNRLTRALKRS